MKFCIYDSYKECDDCMECRCVYDDNKICDKCMKCFDEESKTDYAEILITEIIDDSKTVDEDKNPYDLDD